MGQDGAQQERGEVDEGTESILDEIAALPLEGLPFEGMVRHIQMDRGMEWFNRAFRDEADRHAHTTMQGGHTPQSNGAAAIVVSLVTTICRRASASASLGKHTLGHGRGSMPWKRIMRRR